MPSTETIRGRVDDYLKAVGAGRPADIAALYAPDATVEDPVGAEIRRGLPAIEEFYGALDGVDRATELISLRVAGDTAAFHFRVTTRTADQVIVVEPIDVMTFDADARITSMRAIWSSDDLTIESRAAGADHE